MQPDVSVIVPTFNVGKYIQSSLVSALQQTGVTVEIIVVDDASTDDTVRKITEIGDDRITLLRQPANAGPGPARNRGIAAARGRWIALLDGDDRFLEGRLARLIRRAELEGADMIADNVQIYAEADDFEFPMFSADDFERLGVQLELKDVIKGKVSIFRSYTLAHLQPLFRAGFLKKNHVVYPDDLKVGEDYLFLAHALSVGGVCLLDAMPGYRYTTRHGSLSFRMTSAIVDRMLAVEKSFFAAHPVDEAARRALRHREESLREYRAFLSATEAAEDGDRLGMMKELSVMPTALRFYLEPWWISVRFDIEPYWNKARKMCAPGTVGNDRLALVERMSYSAAILTCFLSSIGFR